MHEARFAYHIIHNDWKNPYNYFSCFATNFVFVDLHCMCPHTFFFICIKLLWELRVLVAVCS